MPHDNVPLPATLPQVKWFRISFCKMRPAPKLERGLQSAATLDKLQSSSRNATPGRIYCLLRTEVRAPVFAVGPAHLFVALVFLAASTVLRAAATWSPAKAPLMTHWAADVTPTNAHPEYPRPQLIRKDWLNQIGRAHV